MSWLAHVERFDEVDTTMAVARARAKHGAPEGTTIVAASQRLGRGRHGRTWFSPSGAGLWMTTVLRPPSSHPMPVLSLVVGVAVRAAAAAMGARAARLKWPNDVVVEQGKLAGILLEGEELEGPAPLVLAGVGLNLASRREAGAPADIPYVGLAELAPPVSVDSALAQVLTALEIWYHRFGVEGVEPVLDAWRDVDALRGLQVRAESHGGPLVGTADGVAASGELRVITPQGLMLVGSGEVEPVQRSW